MNFKEILELIDKVADRGIGDRGDRTGRPEAAHRRQVRAAAAGHPLLRRIAARAACAAAAAAPAPPTAAEKAATVKAEEDAAEAGLHIITSPIVGTFYRSAESGVRSVRQRRRPHLERAGALHHRGDEADERDRVGRRRRRHARSIRRTDSRSSTARSSSR